MRADNYQSENRFVTTTPPTGEPVTLAELKAHMRVDYSDEDDLITALGAAAREQVERLTGCRLMTRIEKMLLDRFPDACGIVIPAAPITAIGAVTYYAADGSSQVFASSNYVADFNGPVGKIVLKSGITWPVLGSEARPVNAVEVAFTSGYATIDAVPPSLKLAVKLLAAHFFENREETTMLSISRLPVGVRQLLLPYKVWEGTV